MKKSEFLKEKKKSTLKDKIVKGMATFLVATSVLACAVACGPKAPPVQTTKIDETTTKIENPVESTEQTNPIDTTKTDETTQGEENTNPEPAEIPTEKIEAFKTRLQNKNFTFETEGTTFLIANDTYDKIESNNNAKIYRTEDEIKYEYTFDAAENKWTKDFSEVSTDFSSQILNFFENATFDSYDSQTGVIVGKIGTNDFSLVLSENGATISNADRTFEISNVGSTTIDIPQTYIDYTIENNDIYTVDDQGNYDFNLVLMKEVLLDWMKGNNRYGRDFLTEFTYDDTLTIQDIIYVNASKENIDIGLLTWCGEQLRYQELQINDKDLYTALANQNLKTKDEFSAHLYNMKKTRTRFSDAIKIDTSLSKADFETITTNIFNHLVNVGTQRSINEEGELHPEYADAKVLFGFAMKGSASIGFDMGNIDSYSFYYFLKSNDEIKFIQIWVEAQNKIENAINDIEGKWLVSSINDKQDIYKGNEDILPKEKFICSETYFEKGMEL